MPTEPENLSVLLKNVWICSVSSDVLFKDPLGIASSVRLEKCVVLLPSNRRVSTSFVIIQGNMLKKKRVAGLFLEYISNVDSVENYYFQDMQWKKDICWSSRCSVKSSNCKILQPIRVFSFDDVCCVMDKRWWEQPPVLFIQFLQLSGSFLKAVILQLNIIILNEF